MARITVEDCLEKVDSQYDLVLLAKERALQLNAGEKALVSKDNDKNTVLALREIGEGKISLKTVEDCLEKIDSQYDLVLLAKERTSQLNAGDPSLVPRDNDKNTVIALREIGEGKISIKTLEDSAINKLRKQQEETFETEDVIDDENEDSFDQIYKGEISKSGTAILPSKRLRRIP